MPEGIFPVVPDNSHDVDLLAQQERLDARRLRAFRAAGPRVEIARGKDWSVMAWRTSDGFCIAHAHAHGGSGCSVGHIPCTNPGDVPSYVVASFGTPATDRDGCGLIGGLVVPTVARVEVELRDGTVMSASTLPAPDALGADLRTFLILTPFDDQPFGPSHPPAVRVYTLIGSDGRVLQRLRNPRPFSR